MVKQGGGNPLGWSYAIAIGIVSGAVVALSFFSGVWWLTFGLSFSLVPICLRVCDFRRAGLCVWVCALAIHMLLNMPLVPTIISLRSIVRLSLFAASCLGIIAWLGVAIMQSAFFAPAGAVLQLVISRLNAFWFVLAYACMWTLSEWVRSLGLMGSQWGCIAYALLPCVKLLQPAEFVGVYGLCFLVAALSAVIALSLAAAIKGNWRGCFGSGLLCMACILGWFYFGAQLAKLWTKRMQDKVNWGSLPVAIVQGNVSWREKQSLDGLRRTFEVHMAMTKASMRHRPELIVWAEASVPTPLNEWTEASSMLREFAKRSGVDMLIGAVEREQSLGRVYNACYGLRADGTFVGTYRKLKLVPFGEFVPLRNYFKFLERIAAHEEDFSHGESVMPLHLSRVSAAVAICFDSLFPWVTRLQAKRDANALVIITNDEWFWGNWMARHHAAVAKLRAIECRLYLVRAANSGVSCIIDPVGRVVAELPLRQRRTLHGAILVPNKHHTTTYVRLGDFVVPFASLLLIAMLIAAWLSRHCRAHLAVRTCE